MKKLNIIAIVFIVGSILFSCVPARQYKDLKSRNKDCEEEREELKNKNKELTVSNTEMESDMEKLKKDIKYLKQDTTVTGKSLRKLTKQYDKINNLNDELLKKLRQKNMNSAAETRKLLAELQSAQEDLQEREDALKKLEESLNKKKADLNKLQMELDEKNNSLQAKNKELIKLQNILNRKDSVVNALRKKVTDALLGFEGEGLTVHEKNGKVYVSLEEKLLFKSGRWDVDPKGQEAIKKLAKVLEKNKDISIMIEGHTDNVPYNGSGGVEDNWDLSVKRATSIVKILLKYSEIDPQRLIASGRSEYLPIDEADTKEARRKNRRTEIILTPKLDELLKILENN